MAFTEIPFVAGVLLAWSLAAPPGPINALMAHAAARRGFLAGWVYGSGAITGDATMLLLTLFGVGQVAKRFPLVALVFALVGAVLMLWLAWGAWRTARKHAAAAKLGSDADDTPEPWWRAFVKSFAIVTTSPYNWGFWLSAGNGTLAVFGARVVVGFFVGILAWTMVWTWLAHAGGARIRRLSELVGYGAAVVLVLFAGVMLVFVATSLRAYF